MRVSYIGAGKMPLIISVSFMVNNTDAVVPSPVSP